MTGAVLACGLLADAALAQESNDQGKSPRGTVGEILRIELNRLEPQQNGACRTYFVVENNTRIAFSEIRLDVFIFDKDGIIVQRVAMTIRPIQPDKTRVVLFDLGGLDCGAIGRFLVNDVLSCQDGTGAEVDCTDGLALTSRAEAALEG